MYSLRYMKYLNYKGYNGGNTWARLHLQGHLNGVEFPNLNKRNQ